MQHLTIRAYGKINISLEILGRREDGFHEIRTILQTVSIWDDISFKDSGSIRINCDIPNLNGADNIAYSAVMLTNEFCKTKRGIDIEIKKGIPLSAGLGGGSSNAAASLKAANQIWGLNLSKNHLESIAGKVGSDVPFFLYGGTCLASGRGEKITELPSILGLFILLVSPKHQITRKTSLLYGNLTEKHFSSGESVTETANGILQGSILRQETMTNTFTSLAYEIFPNLFECRETMKDVGITNIHLSGAGPTLFAVESDWDKISSWKDMLKHRGIYAQIVTPISTPFRSEPNLAN